MKLFPERGQPSLQIGLHILPPPVFNLNSDILKRFCRRLRNHYFIGHLADKNLFLNSSKVIVRPAFTSSCPLLIPSSTC